MPLIVEDGGIIAGANSYVALADSDTFFTDRALTTPTEAQLLQAMDIIETLTYLGAKTDAATQELLWPRSGVCDVDGNEYSNGIIPDALKKGQMWLAYYISQGSNPSDVSTTAAGTGALKGAVIDVIEVEYYDSATASSVRLSLSDLPNAWSYLKHLLLNGGGFGGGSSVIGATYHA